MANLQRIITSRLPRTSDRRLVVITGARQVGKTTLARATYPALRYLNLDAVEERESLRGVPTHTWAKRVGASVLDEAHKEPTVFDKLKFAFDSGALDFSVLLGSAQILLLSRVRETLAGRVFLYELFPLTLGEIAAGGAEVPTTLLERLLAALVRAEELLMEEPGRLLADEESRRIDAASHLSAWGGMPSLLALSADDRRQWLRSYHDTYLQRDLADLARLRDLEPFTKFQRLAALRSGGLLSFSDLARDAGTSAGTARNYLEYLKISYQTFLLQPFQRSVTSSLVKSPKLYWSDVGIARHLTGAWGPCSGLLFENLVVAEAVKLIRSRAHDAEPSFYRTRSGLEIDLVLETTSGMLAIEVKAREKWDHADLRSLRALADGLGEELRLGLVVTQGGGIERTADPRIWAVPVHRLFT
jgi:hypothetical protein